MAEPEKQGTAAPRTALSEKIAEIVIPRLDKRMAEITIVGQTRLVTHRFGEKELKKMIEDQEKAGKIKPGKRGPRGRDPQREYENATYQISGQPERYGFPTSGIKRAAIQACKYARGITEEYCKGAFQVIGDLARIDGSDPVMRMDMRKVGSWGRKQSDPVYRPSFEPPWSITFTVIYNAEVITLEHILGLYNLAGFHVGLGEKRPAQGYDWGMFGLAERVPGAVASSMQSQGKKEVAA